MTMKLINTCQISLWAYTYQIMPGHSGIFRLTLAVVLEPELLVVRHETVIGDDRDSLSPASLLHVVGIRRHERLAETRPLAVRRDGKGVQCDGRAVLLVANLVVGLRVGFPLGRESHVLIPHRLVCRHCGNDVSNQHMVV